MTEVIYIYIYIYIFQVPRRRSRRGVCSHAASFSKIAFYQECFLGNLLLCHYPRHPKTFLAPALTEFCRGPVSCMEKIYNLASSGYGYSDIPLINISS